MQPRPPVIEVLEPHRLERDAVWLVVVGERLHDPVRTHVVEAAAAGDVSATLFPLGTTLYLAGLGCFHRALSGRWPSTRLAAALAVAVLVTPAALWLGGAAALGAASALLLMLATWETRHTTRTLAASDRIKMGPVDG